MYCGDGYLENKKLINSFEKLSVTQNKDEYKNENNITCSNIPNDKGDSVTWNDEYSARLAIFMKNSKTLLENIDKKQKLTLNHQNHSVNKTNKNDINNLSESPTHSLIELENNLQQLENSKYKSNDHMGYSTEKSKLENNLNMVEVKNNPKSKEIECSQKSVINKQHNFQEGLRIDELENQLSKLKKELDLKEDKMKLMQIEFQTENKNMETPNKRNHQIPSIDSNNLLLRNQKAPNEFSDNIIINNKMMSCHVIPNECKDQNKPYKQQNTSNIMNQNKRCIATDDSQNGEYHSIKDYNPNNPIVLQNKIKDLESQIQDLQEANEMASQFFSTLRDTRNKTSGVDSNGIISELVIKNQSLSEEVEKLRKHSQMTNEDSSSTRFLRNELENLKEDLSILKQQNNMIVVENIKLKNLMKKVGLINESEYSDQEKIQEHQLNSGTELNENINLDSIFQKNEFISTIYTEKKENDIKKTNYSDFSFEKINVDFSNDSTDSILSDVTKDIEKINAQTSKSKNCYKFQVSNNYHNKTINDREDLVINDGTYEFTSEVERTNPNTEYHSEINNKFSTLGRTAFAPRTGIDINTSDVVKFIRQGGRISKGLVHFIGHLPMRNDIYLGIELEVEDGKHDGIYNGKRYFQCRKNKGVFVAFNKIIMVYSKKS